MKVTDTKIPEVKLIEPKVFEDERGFFFESFNQKKFEDAIGRELRFLQDNHSKSRKGVLRGLHYQLAPCAQEKLVRVVRGEVFDIAVDIRRSSPTFGQWIGEILSTENKRQLWIPQGFAHGFFTLSETAEILYKASNEYVPHLERTIRWDDKILSIEWPTQTPLLSPRDQRGQSLSDAEVFP